MYRYTDTFQVPLRNTINMKLSKDGVRGGTSSKYCGCNSSESHREQTTSPSLTVTTAQWRVYLKS
jgi:hypothetical protein